MGDRFHNWSYESSHGNIHIFFNINRKTCEPFLIHISTPKQTINRGNNVINNGQQVRTAFRRLQGIHLHGKYMNVVTLISKQIC
jgi:hypothetical protein